MPWLSYACVTGLELNENGALLLGKNGNGAMARSSEWVARTCDNKGRLVQSKNCYVSSLRQASTCLFHMMVVMSGRV
jgi:hypothetical protein